MHNRVTFVVFAFPSYMNGNKSSYERKCNYLEVVMAGSQAGKQASPMLCAGTGLFLSQCESLSFLGKNGKRS